MRPVLLVEDNDDDVFLMKCAWQKARISHNLRTADDGQAAIDFLQAATLSPDNDAVPCLVLLDLKMPHVPGLELLAWIRNRPHLHTLPVAILTASSADTDVESAYRLGANSYFVKPSESSSLYDLVKVLDEYWLKRCLIPPYSAPEPSGPETK